MPDTPLPIELQAVSDRQAARLNDPRAHETVRERTALAMARLQGDDRRLRTQVKELEKAPRIPQKIFWLREIAATFANAVQPHAACAPQCDHCCRQPVALTQEEAEMIARATGAALHQPAAWGTQGEEQYIAQPCPFLRESRCTIYANRPMVCRLMFSMDTDALLCERVPGALAPIPTADNLPYKELYIRAHLGRVKSDAEMAEALGRLRLADIRAFFPQGLGPR